MSYPTQTRGWRHHLDGWQAGMVVMLLAGSAILLVVPRGAAPEWIPPPRIDRQALALVMAEDDARARRAADGKLDVDVRALGRELRAYNTAAASGDEERFEQAHGAVARAAPLAWAVSPSQVLDLRAYQLVRFLAELRHWQATGVQSDELKATGGDFVATLGRNAWCRGEGRELVVDEAELRVLFKKRWSSVAGLNASQLAPSTAEEQLRLGLLLLYPFRKNEAVNELPFAPLVRERHLAPQRIQTIDRLVALDPTYPGELAKGVVLFNSSQFALAAEAFRAHLEAFPDGPYTLRARGHLKAALDRARQLLPP